MTKQQLLLNDNKTGFSIFAQTFKPFKHSDQLYFRDLWLVSRMTWASFFEQFELLRHRATTLRFMLPVVALVLPHSALLANATALSQALTLKWNQPSMVMLSLARYVAMEAMANSPFPSCSSMVQVSPFRLESIQTLISLSRVATCQRTWVASWAHSWAKTAIELFKMRTSQILACSLPINWRPVLHSNDTITIEIAGH